MAELGKVAEIVVPAGYFCMGDLVDLSGYGRPQLHTLLSDGRPRRVRNMRKFSNSQAVRPNRSRGKCRATGESALTQP